MIDSDGAGDRSTVSGGGDSSCRCYCGNDNNIISGIGGDDGGSSVGIIGEISFRDT